LPESCLADKLAFVERNRRIIRRIAEVCGAQGCRTRCLSESINGCRARIVVGSPGPSHSFSPMNREV
jgi:hypothetical protein